MRLLRRGVNMMRSRIPAPDEREVLRALRVPHATRIADVEERGVRESITLALDRALGMASFEGVVRTAEVVEIREDEVVTEESPPGLLHVNVGVPLVDEAAMLEKAVLAVQNVTDLPLVVDSANVHALERGIRAFPGRPWPRRKRSRRSA